MKHCDHHRFSPVSTPFPPHPVWDENIFFSTQKTATLILQHSGILFKSQSLLTQHHNPVRCGLGWNTSGRHHIIHQKSLVFRITGESLSIGSTDLCILSNVQLQRLIRCHQISSEMIQCHLLISAQHRNDLCLELWWIDQWYRKTAVIKCCHPHSRPELSAVYDQRLGTNHKIHDPILCPDCHHLMTAVISPRNI